MSSNVFIYHSISFFPQVKKKWPWMEQYVRNWATYDMIRQYLRGRSYHGRRKEKHREDTTSDDELADSLDPDINFDPYTALHTEQHDENEGDDLEEGKFNIMNVNDAADSTYNLTATKAPLPAVDNSRLNQASKPMIEQTTIQANIKTKQNETVFDISEGAHISRHTIHYVSNNNIKDHDPSSVFVDEDGFFLDYKDNVIETRYNAKNNLYMLADGSTLLLDAWPDSLENYATCFDDGVSRRQNSSGHWRVGSRELNNHCDINLPSPMRILSNSAASPSTYISESHQSSTPEKTITTSLSTICKATAVSVIVPDSPLSVLSDSSLEFSLTKSQQRDEMPLKRKRAIKDMDSQSRKRTKGKGSTRSKGKRLPVCSDSFEPKKLTLTRFSGRGGGLECFMLIYVISNASSN